ncbi:hypothetical protein, partial [Bifidobacterium callitrichidarum]
MTDENTVARAQSNPLVNTKHYRVVRREYKDLINYSIAGYPCEHEKCWPPQVSVSKDPIELRLYERFDNYQRNISVDDYANLITYMTGIRDWRLYTAPR